MGSARGWFGMQAFVSLAILFAVPAGALDTEVGWRLEDAPTVVTLEATDVTQTTALLRGSLTDLGGAGSVQVSFEWGPSPALGAETAPRAVSLLGPFEAPLDQLDPGTTLYFRAKATGNGTALGETLTFQTAPPTLAGDLFSQLWLYLVIAAAAAVAGYVLMRKGVFARGGRLGARFGLGGARATPVPLGAGREDDEAPEIICPHCGTLLQSGAVSCFGCGRGLSEGVDLDRRLDMARGALEQNERDRDALFTLGAHLAAAGKGEEALEALNTLTMLDPHYPGLWWVKARVFESLDNKPAAESAMMRAMEEHGEAGVEALLTAAGRVEAPRDGVSESTPEPVEGPPEAAEAPPDEGPSEPETCPHCGTALDEGTGNCSGCGRSVLDQGEALEQKVKRSLAALELDENDADALFTLGAYLLLDEKPQEALDTLNRLTLQDPSYPGLWWVKARVFEKLGNKKAAESALARAQQGDEGLLEEEP